MGSESQAPTPARDAQRTAPCPTSDVDHSVVQLLKSYKLLEYTTDILNGDCVGFEQVT